MSACPRRIYHALAKGTAKNIYHALAKGAAKNFLTPIVRVVR